MPSANEPDLPAKLGLIASVRECAESTDYFYRVETKGVDK